MKIHNENISPIKKLEIELLVNEREINDLRETISYWTALAQKFKDMCREYETKTQKITWHYERIGSSRNAICMNCKAEYDAIKLVDANANSLEPNYCPNCGGKIGHI